MRKKKLLVTSDSYNVYTGFACVGRHITDHLYKTGRYDIAYLCWFYSHMNTHLQPPFTLYTTLRDHGRCCKRSPSVVKIEPGQKITHYASQEGALIPLQADRPPCLGGNNIEIDKYAFQSLHGVILDFQPDIILTIGDCWMVYHYQFMDVRKSYKAVVYFPVDGTPTSMITEMGPQVINWVETIDRADKPFAFTDFGRDGIIATGKKANTDLSKVGVIPHGCDTKVYHPLSIEKRKELKKKIFKLDDEVFLIGCFSRNQPRKAFHKLMEALRLGKARGYWDGKTIKCYFHCFPKGHSIRTDLGMVDISKIKEGNRVLTHTGEYKEVIATKSREYEGDMIRIKTGFNDKSLISTDSHRYFVIKSDNCTMKHRDHLVCKPTCSQQFRKYIKEDGSITYWNQCTSKPYKDYKLSKVEAKDIEVGDIVAYPITHPADNKSPLSDLIGDEDQLLYMYRVIGLYLAEGNVSGKTDNYIAFTLNETEVEFKEQIIRMFDRYGIHCTVTDIPDRHAVRVTANSSKWARFFKKHFNTGSHDKVVPEWLLTLSHQFNLEELLAYYINGDGNLIKGGYEINSVSYSLVHGIRDILLRCGVIPSSITTKEAGSGSYKEGSISYRLTITGAGAQRLCDQTSLSMFEGYNQSNRFSRPWIERTKNGTYIYTQVREVEIIKDQKETVYNIQVEDDESYTVDGVLSSNCPIKDVGWNLPWLIKWHSLEDIVILNDKLKVGTGPTDIELNEYYNACDLMTLPSRGEGWGLTYSEAMAAGIPVLMSSYSAHHDWAKGCAGRIKTLCLDSEPITNIDRAIVDVEDYCEKLKAFYDNMPINEYINKFGLEDYKGNKYTSDETIGVREYFAREGRKLCESELDWSVVCDRWEKEIDAVDTSDNHAYPRLNLPKQVNLEDLLDKEKKDRLLYVMPGTFGDVFLSTAVIDSLSKKYPDKDIYFATNKPFQSILDGNKKIYKVLDYSPILNNPLAMNQLFEMTFTPFMETQGSNNWTKNGYGKHLAQVYADSCGVELGKPFLQILDFQDAPEEDYVVVHTKTGQEPKNYLDYQRAVDRIDMKVLQIGGKDDPLLKGVVDCRGTYIQETAGILKKAKLFIGGDSICMHVAGYVGTDMVLLYSSTFFELTKPLTQTDVKMAVIEPEERFGCDRACHMAKCFRNVRSCIDNIPYAMVVEALTKLEIPTKEGPPPKISGYGYTYNPDKYYPWRECIESMLGFCDEVVIADAGSKDGTYEELKEWKKREPKLKVYRKRWRDDEPMMDGMMKAYARALCTGDYCWQMDMDEIVHEDDYGTIRELAKEFPINLKMATLPVLDLYGASDKVRCDRGLYKWRLSRNLPEITHGIPKQLRKKNKDGKIYCDKDQCDGCFPINSETGLMIDGQTTFMTPEVMGAMKDDSTKYKEFMVDFFKTMPSIWHFSWANLERRIKVDLEFWDKQWASLDQSEVKPETRFLPGVARGDITPDLIKERAEFLRDKTLDGKLMNLITIDWKQPPKVIQEWLKKKD